MPKLNPFIEKSKRIFCAKENENMRDHFEVDCSGGNNPYGFSPAVKSALAVIHGKEKAFNEYPHGLTLKEAIADYWSKYVALDINRIVLSSGVSNSIFITNLLFQQPNASILGISPQYTDYICCAQLLGYTYRSVPLLKKDKYKFDVNRMLDGITSDLSLIYIDSPNNPTGQAIPLSEIRIVLDKAGSHDICVIIDEAYGDYFSLENSSATLLNEYDNLIIIRSFSKGLGLAGIRCGYILTSEHLKHQLDKISNAYSVSEPSRIIAKVSLSDTDYIKACREQFTKSKDELMKHIGDRLHMAHTLSSCPILLLWHDDTTIKLSSEFAKYGVKVLPCTEFESLAANSARIHLPRQNHMEQLIFAIDKINSDSKIK